MNYNLSTVLQTLYLKALVRNQKFKNLLDNTQILQNLIFSIMKQSRELR